MGEIVSAVKVNHRLRGLRNINGENVNGLGARDACWPARRWRWRKPAQMYVYMPAPRTLVYIMTWPGGVSGGRAYL
jgi:hypothetical protein